MPDISRSEKTIKQLFIGKCWEYLNNNFHKFTTTNQIKVALELCKKDMPTVMEGGLSINKMPTIKVNGKDLEANVGSDRATPDVGHTGETPSGDNQD